MTLNDPECGDCRQPSASRACSSPDELTGRCLRTPEWEVFAAYDQQTHSHVDPAHPLVARYPGAMFVTCGPHLTSLIRADAAAPGSTEQWVVRRVAAR